MSPAFLLALASTANGRGCEAGLGEVAFGEVANDRGTWPVESDPSYLTLTQEQGFLGREDASVHILSNSGKCLITSLRRQLRDCLGLPPIRASCPSELSRAACQGVRSTRGPALLPLALSLFVKILGYCNSGLSPPQWQ